MYEVKLIANTTPIIFNKTPLKASERENLKRYEVLEEIKKTTINNTIDENINLFLEILTIRPFISAPLTPQRCIK